jgi:hypothetical protein
MQEAIVSIGWSDWVAASGAAKRTPVKDAFG